MVTLAGPDLECQPGGSPIRVGTGETDFPPLRGQYFLSEIRTPDGSREFPMSRVEVETRKTASAGRASEKIVLAMR